MLQALSQNVLERCTQIQEIELPVQMNYLQIYRVHAAVNLQQCQIMNITLQQKDLYGLVQVGQLYLYQMLMQVDQQKKQITKHYGILDFFEYGDDVMVEREFDIQNILPKGSAI